MPELGKQLCRRWGACIDVGARTQALHGGRTTRCRATAHALAGTPCPVPPGQDSRRQFGCERRLGFSNPNRPSREPPPPGRPRSHRPTATSGDASVPAALLVEPAPGPEAPALGQPHPPAGAAPASRPTALDRLCQAPVKLAHGGRLTARSLAGRSRPRGAASWPGLPGLDYARAHRPGPYRGHAHCWGCRDSRAAEPPAQAGVGARLARACAPPWGIRPCWGGCPRRGSRLRASRGSPAPAGSEADAGNARPRAQGCPHRSSISASHDRAGPDLPDQGSARAPRNAMEVSSATTWQFLEV